MSILRRLQYDLLDKFQQRQELRFSEKKIQPFRVLPVSKFLVMNVTRTKLLASRVPRTRSTYGTDGFHPVSQQSFCYRLGIFSVSDPPPISPHLCRNRMSIVLFLVDLSCCNVAAHSSFFPTFKAHCCPEGKVCSHTVAVLPLPSFLPTSIRACDGGSPATCWYTSILETRKKKGQRSKRVTTKKKKTSDDGRRKKRVTTKKKKKWQTF